MARKASGACPVDLKVSKSQTTHALYPAFAGFFSGSRVSGNHAAHSRYRTQSTVCQVGAKILKKIITIFWDLYKF